MSRAGGRWTEGAPTRAAASSCGAGGVARRGFSARLLADSRSQRTKSEVGPGYRSPLSPNEVGTVRVWALGPWCGS